MKIPTLMNHHKIKISMDRSHPKHVRIEYIQGIQIYTQNYHHGLDIDGDQDNDNIADWVEEIATDNWAWFTRGYTGHEMLPEFGLINMNGRAYDPVLGRMLQVDNYIQNPFSSQSYNRYSYVLNNPLKYVDLDGEFVTWSISNGGFSIGFNLTPIGMPLGAGINIGYGDGYSLGIYGEVGYRVGGTGLGVGGTVSRSINYNFKHQNVSSTTSIGVFASIGPVNVGGNVYINHDITKKRTTTGWGVYAGVGVGNEKEGLGLYIGYGSNGLSYGLNGYYNPRINQSRYNVIIVANDDGTYNEQLAQIDFLEGKSVDRNDYSTNLRNNPNVTETRNPDGTYTYVVKAPKRSTISTATVPASTNVLSFSRDKNNFTFTTLNRASVGTFLGSKPYSINIINFKNYQPYPTSIHYNSLFYSRYDF